MSSPAAAKARLAALTAAGALQLAAPTAARAATHTLTASEGPVTAQLSYSSASEEGSEPVKGLRLTIERAGAKLYDAPVKSSHCTPCGLERFAGGPLLVRDLEGNGQPDVIVEMYTGGAHCCTLMQLFTYDPGTMAYRMIERDLGDPGGKIDDLDDNGSFQIVTADDRFAYEFAPFAYSGLPLQVLAVRAGRFVNVTRSYPAAIAKDAAGWLKTFRSERHLQLGNGAIAAWAADEELLRHDRLVRSTLAREADRRNLRSRESYGPSNGSFVRALLRFLARTGYR